MSLALQSSAPTRVASPEKKRFLPVSFPVLWLMYAVVPLCLLVVLVDWWLMKGVLRRLLPGDPEQLRFVTIFLVYPHIVASANSFIDKEYLVFYKRKLGEALAVACLLAFVVPALFGPKVDELVFAGYTVYHVMAQQIGITTMMTGKPDFRFKCWKWLSLVVIAAIYIPVYSDIDVTLLTSPILGVAPSRFIFGAAAFLLGLLAFFSFWAAARSQTKIGGRYLWSNTGMIIAAAGFYAAGYPFFSILVPRLIHDLSGFAFYVAHDHNRNAGGGKNLLYNLFKSARVPVYLLSPLLGIAFANGLVEMSGFAWVERALTALSYFHYYTEGFMWKRGTLHRQAIGGLRGLSLSPGPSDAAG